MKAETVVPILVAALLLHVPLVLALGVVVLALLAPRPRRANGERTSRSPSATLLTHTLSGASSGGGQDRAEDHAGLGRLAAVEFQAGALGGEHDGFLALLQLVALPGELGKALRSID